MLFSAFKNPLTPDKNCGECILCHQQPEDTFDQLGDTLRTHQKNQVLFVAGSPFGFLYTVKSGMFKSTYLTADGNERIVEVFLPGQVMGFDGIHQGHYKTTVKAIGTATYCAISYETLKQVACDHPDINLRLMRMMSGKIFKFEAAFNDQPAKQKVVEFIMQVSDHFRRHGFSAHQFPFPISQRDLANYLNLAEETLSRVMKRLKQDNTLVLKNQQIQINDLSLLRQAMS